MGLGINFKELHNAIERLRNGDALDANDRELLMKIIEAASGVFYPSKSDLLAQEEREQALSIMDPETYPDRFGLLVEGSTEYRKKYE